MKKTDTSPRALRELKIEQIILPLVLIALAAGARLLAHEPNFTPLGAMALFSGVYLAGATARSRAASLAVPLAALLASDILIGFYNPGVMAAVYASFVASIAIGWVIRGRVTTTRVALGAVAGSVQFFLMTNFAVWLFQNGSYYPKTLAGLASCFAAGLPFFRNTLAGDLFYTAAIFGAYALAHTTVERLISNRRARATQNI